jgi:hypothetical protein
MTASSCRKVFKMHFPFLILNFFLAYVAASEVTIDDQKESKIRYTVNQIMRVIENEIKNQTIEQGSLSKRNYGFYPDILKQYYPIAYGIVKSGCDENNPYLYRPAPGGGFYHPAASAVYKREEEVDQDVDALTENVKIIQKQLAMEWEKLSSQYNSLTRRGGFITNGFGDAAQSMAQYTANGLGRHVVPGAYGHMPSHQSVAQYSANGFGGHVVPGSYGHIPNYEPYSAAAAHNMRNYHSQAYHGGHNVPNIEYQSHPAGQLPRQEVASPSEHDFRAQSEPEVRDSTQVEEASKPAGHSVDESPGKAVLQKNWQNIAAGVGLVLLTSFFIIWFLRILFVYHIPALKNMTKND